MRETFQDFGKNAKAKVEKMESVTREHPKTALTTAVLAGAAMGALVFAALSLSMRSNREGE
jgi:chloramphenicol O-acetyltransferase